MPTVHDLAAALPTLIPEWEHEGDDPFGVWAPSDREVVRLGYAVEPTEAVLEAAIQARLDALLLHRPWRLDPARLPPEAGVLAVHKALDDRLSTGWSPALADALGLTMDGAPMRYKDRRIGMVGDVDEPAVWEVWVARLGETFGGAEAVLNPPRSVRVERIAAVGAFTDALVREAVERGTDLYLTGQLRKPGREAAAEVGLGVVAVGQARAEQWGLRWLAGVLAERFNLQTIDLDAAAD